MPRTSLQGQRRRYHLQGRRRADQYAYPTHSRGLFTMDIESTVDNLNPVAHER